MKFDAVVIATGPAASNVVCGLTLKERGRRVAVKAGAEQVLVLDTANTTANTTANAPASTTTGVQCQNAGSLHQWATDRQPGKSVLIIRASDQVVHLPLVAAVKPASATDDTARIAVTPDNGEYAGAMWVPSSAVAEALAILAENPLEGDRLLAARWLSATPAGNPTPTIETRSTKAVPVPHGEIARHPAVTAAERRQATRMLFRLVHKPQDGPVTRWLYRPVSYPITRLLLPTPVKPNHVSTAVLLLGVLGCYLTAGPSYWHVVIGSAIVLFAGYLDSCDGEIARLKHETSKLGAWLDTASDEATTLMYLVALGWHVYGRHPLPWVGWSIVVGAGATLVSIFVIYHYLIFVSHTCNSQDYPSTSLGLLAPLAHLLRRDFINWGALVLVIANAAAVAYALLVLGSLVTASILLPQHLARRRMDSSVA
ncbi:MAG: CDP-alcohol phosphatidyltransferase family protein [Pseudomonadota bacterium]